VNAARFGLLLALLVAIAAGTWLVLSRHSGGGGETLTVYYTKIDGKTLGTLSVSLRPQQSGESADEHRRNIARYAAVEAVTGPPSDVEAIRFPAQTRVAGVQLNGTTATVDLSKEVESQAGGSFGENGEFKALVYTMTGLPGIDAVQVTVGGQTLPALPGGHLELDQPLHRSDF
jgi:spore germination protein GerM